MGCTPLLAFIAFWPQPEGTGRSGRISLSDSLAIFAILPHSPPGTASHIASVAHVSIIAISSSIPARLIAWQKRHGRHHLPWQNTRDPYAIWVAEIMLQQTQVATVVPYYRRFMGRFPDVHALAAAQLDE